MKRFSLLLFAAVSVGLVGCSGNSAKNASEVAPGAAKNQGLVTKNHEPKQVETGGIDQGKQDPKPTTNKDRFYQLSDLHTVEISYEGKKIKVWLMDNDDKRAEGMMHLTSAEVKDSEGMLFVFPEEKPLSFWMKNTKVPLDIAYISSKGKVVSTRALKPMNEDPVPSGGAAMFALEMKLGAFKRLGIKQGRKFVIPDSVKAQ